ncbi:MAG: hypothetical protein IT376_10330 [Polyangiaceae bacterium]|nr:hypothetical protein [Polyangiaceae bacterium]
MPTLVRTLLSIPELELRAAWLRARVLESPLERSAAELDALCDANERSEPSAREAALVVAVVLAGDADGTLVAALRRRAESARHLALGRLLRRGAPAALLEASEERVPDYGVGRELTVGERRSLARLPDRRSFEKLVLDPHPLVVRQLLGNPRLTEGDVLRLAARRPARVEALRVLADFPRWLSRRRVRMALLHNPGCPVGISLPLVAVCTRVELRSLVESTETQLVIRATAHELLERRPPLPAPDPAERLLM